MRWTWVQCEGRIGVAEPLRDLADFFPPSNSLNAQVCRKEWKPSHGAPARSEAPSSTRRRLLSEYREPVRVANIGAPPAPGTPTTAAGPSRATAKGPSSSRWRAYRRTSGGPTSASRHPAKNGSECCSNARSRTGLTPRSAARAPLVPGGRFRRPGERTYLAPLCACVRFRGVTGR